MLNAQTTCGNMTARLWHAQLVRRVHGRRLRQAHSSVQRGSAAHAQKFPWNMSWCLTTRHLAHKALQLSTSRFMKEELSWTPLASWLEHNFRVETRLAPTVRMFRQEARTTNCAPGLSSATFQSTMCDIRPQRPRLLERRSSSSPCSTRVSTR